MRQGKLALTLTLFFLLACDIGCTDTGDSSAIPGVETGADATSDGGEVQQEGNGGSTYDATVQQSGDSSSRGMDAPIVEANVGEEPVAPDTFIADAGEMDTTAADVGMPEEASSDATQESGPADAGAEAEAETSETGMPDAADDARGDSTMTDAGPADAPPDGGESESGSDASADVADTGAKDAGADAEPDGGHTEAGNDSGGGPLSPCATAPCASSGANSLECKGNADGVCTPTEAIVLAYDIATNHVTAATPTTKADSCYYCMVASKCLDSAPRGSISGVTTENGIGLECEDPASSNNTASTDPVKCRDALTCTLTSNHCTTTTPDMASTDPNASVSNCYCGTNLGASCLSAGPNGVCLRNEQMDLGSTDPTTVLANFTDGSMTPGGVGNQILNCALTGACNICFN